MYCKIHVLINDQYNKNSNIHDMNLFQSIKTKIKSLIFRTLRFDQIFSKFDQMNSFDMQSFFLSNVPKNTVLICEFYYGHGECLPGYVNYFLTLGYNVHVVINVDNYILGTFTKSNFPENKVKFFIVYDYILYNNLFLKKVIWYQYVILASSGSGLFHFEQNYIKAYNKYNFYHIEHDMQNYHEIYVKKICDKDYFKKSILLIRDNPNYPWLIPLYFYDNVLIKKSKNTIINFICVGAIAKQYKNYDLLFDVMRELIARNIRNFKVTIVGYFGDLSVFKMQGLDGYLDIRGRLPYDSMYECVEQADFLLSLLDMSNKYNVKAYIQNWQTSGTNNLSIGFQTPCLYDKSFGKSFGFSDSSALFYSDNNLLEAMLRAMEMSDTEYQLLQKNLLQMKLALEAESLENLEKIFGRVN